MGSTCSAHDTPRPLGLTTSRGDVYVVVHYDQMCHLTKFKTEKEAEVYYKAVKKRSRALIAPSGHLLKQSYKDDEEKRKLLDHYAKVIVFLHRPKDSHRNPRINWQMSSSSTVSTRPKSHSVQNQKDSRDSGKRHHRRHTSMLYSESFENFAGGSVFSTRDSKIIVQNNSNRTCHTRRHSSQSHWDHQYYHRQGPQHESDQQSSSHLHIDRRTTTTTEISQQNFGFSQRQFTKKKQNLHRGSFHQDRLDKLARQRLKSPNYHRGAQNHTSDKQYQFHREEAYHGNKDPRIAQNLEKFQRLEKQYSRKHPRAHGDCSRGSLNLESSRSPDSQRRRQKGSRSTSVMSGDIKINSWNPIDLGEEGPLSSSRSVPGGMFFPTGGTTPPPHYNTRRLSKTPESRDRISQESRERTSSESWERRGQPQKKTKTQRATNTTEPSHLLSKAKQALQDDFEEMFAKRRPPRRQRGTKRSDMEDMKHYLKEFLLPAGLTYNPNEPLHSVTRRESTSSCSTASSKEQNSVRSTYGGVPAKDWRLKGGLNGAEMNLGNISLKIKNRRLHELNELQNRRRTMEEEKKYLIRKQWNVTESHPLYATEQSRTRNIAKLDEGLEELALREIELQETMRLAMNREKLRRAAEEMSALAEEFKKVRDTKELSTKLRRKRISYLIQQTRALEGSIGAGPAWNNPDFWQDNTGDATE